MNLDLLIKLVKLANNNPNEHEANSAARRACKLIAEGNYEFNQPRTAQQKVNVNQGNQNQWNPPPPKRDSGFRGYSNPSGSTYDWFRDFYESVREENDTNQRRRNQQNVYEEKNFWDEPAKKPKIRRVCTKCGVDVETARWKEEPFVCNVCHWSIYP